MSDEKKPLGVDHTGEVWENREVIGPGRIEYHARRANNGKMSCAREQLWRWRCTKCGAEGECRYYLTQYPHKCKTPQQTKAAKKDEPYVCTEQCKDCGHYRTLNGATFGRCCHYSVDAGSRRPKVDLRTEPCPVRDETYKAPRAKPEMVVSSFRILERIAESNGHTK